MNTYSPTCSSRIYHYLCLFSFVVVAILLFCTSPGSAQIYDGHMPVENALKARGDTHDITAANTGPTITAPPPSIITIVINGSIPVNGTLINITALPTPTATTTAFVLPPVPVQPFTTQGVGPFPTAHGPLPLPTTPAWFPQNISSCTMCYGHFQTLSRCNAIANSGMFPVTSNTTYADLLPFLKCICTYKVLDTYPFCIDCLNRTQQLNQLNVLQAFHLESYQDAFHQLCGATHNGNRLPGAAAPSMRTVASRWSLLVVQCVLIGGTALLNSIFM